jgi:hypothetical protein
VNLLSYGKIFVESEPVTCNYSVTDYYYYYYYLLVRPYYLSTDVFYTKFVRYNLKASHHRDVFNCRLIGKNSYRASRYFYDLSTYQISRNWLQCSIIVAIKPEAKYMILYA